MRPSTTKLGICGVRLKTDSKKTLLNAVSVSLMTFGLTACAVTPEAINDAELLNRVETNLADMYEDQEPVSGPMDLYEADARGLKYNLDKRLKMMERSLEEARLARTHADFLPQIAVKAGYRRRDNFAASSSLNLQTGLQNFGNSTSSDKKLRTADLQMVWNVLDFGLTYLRAKNEADRVLIAEERRIKVAQNLILDIRDSFWRALGSQRLLPQVNKLIRDINTTIGRSKNLISGGTGEPQKELQSQRELLNHLSDLMEVRRRLSLATTELAALINIPPGEQLRLIIRKSSDMSVPGLRARYSDIEIAALLNRPELREEDYKRRITETDLRAAYVRLLPGLELRYGPNYDSNSFLLHDNWSNVGVAVTKNLMEIATAPRAIKFAETDRDVATARQMALSMAVVAQVHISLQRFALSKDILRVSTRLLSIDRKLSGIADESSEASDGSELDALSARSREIVSELRYYAAFADVQNSFGRIINSVGSHRLPEEFEDMDVRSLARELRSVLDEWSPPFGEMTVAQN